MKIFWTMVLTYILSFNQSQAAVSTKILSDFDLKMNLTYDTKEWLILDSSDYAASGSMFLAKPLDKKLEQALLTLRVDTADLKDAKKYTEKWLKDYPKFGFDLLLSQEAQYGEFKGYEIEMISPKTNKKLRQFVSKTSQNKFLIFTCSSEKAEFPEALKSCQKLLSAAKLVNTENSAVPTLTK